jgi:hypothetical protein
MKTGRAESCRVQLLGKAQHHSLAGGLRLRPYNPYSGEKTNGLTNDGRTATDVNPLDETQNSASAEYPRRTVGITGIEVDVAPSCGSGFRPSANIEII